jgi:hypothetical protein
MAFVETSRTVRGKHRRQRAAQDDEQNKSKAAKGSLILPQSLADFSGAHWLFLEQNLTKDI